MPESWWLEDFQNRLPQEQERMRREKPLRGTSAYLQALEEWEAKENLNLLSPRTASSTRSHLTFGRSIREIQKENSHG